MTVVRPAAIVMPALTAGQRRRRQAANRLGAELTDAARQGRQPCVEIDIPMPPRLIAEASDIIVQAPQLAADPQPAGLRVGRNRHGKPVAVVLHSDRWSLVVRPRGPATDRPAASWAFLDGYGAVYGLTHVGFLIADDPGPVGVAWTEMLAHVLALTA
ncbi:hypothetical protein E1258_20505 [Micromonospora sp. KC207]|uniref:hypothetical protein n=1 Tax=Micromonospora sp. KC207 TaxID=2530377 RepID=UPI0010537FDA|nr:hypothetical protein [Micromonospora sp. KC207]TDC58596.1 hypothetical protein E1258_20505 [Micromonospora sp. KC207]